MWAVEASFYILTVAKGQAEEPQKAETDPKHVLMGSPAPA